MLLKGFTLLIGLLLTTIGLISCLCYLNFLTLQYNFFDYIQFISKDIFCWCLPIGANILFLYVLLGGER